MVPFVPGTALDFGFRRQRSSELWISTHRIIQSALGNFPFPVLIRLYATADHHSLSLPFRALPCLAPILPTHRPQLTKLSILPHHSRPIISHNYCYPLIVHSFTPPPISFISARLLRPTASLLRPSLTQSSYHSRNFSIPIPCSLPRPPVRMAPNKYDKTRREIALGFISGDAHSPGRYSGNPPRKLSALQASLPILVAGRTTACRDDAELLTAERFEAARRLPVCNGKGLCKRSDRLVVGCACRTDGCGVTAWSFRAGADLWACVKLLPFVCTDEPKPSRHFGTTAYSVGMLRPLLLARVAEDQFTVSMATTLLSQYCARPLPKSFVRRVVDSCSESEDGLTTLTERLPCVIAALADKGWLATLFTVSADEMHAELMDTARADHEHAQKELPLDKQSPFDPTIVPNCPLDKRYVVGYALAPPHVAQLYAQCHPISMADFVHCANRTHGGTLGSRYVLDANRDLVDLVHVRLLLNECERAWDVLNRFTNVFIQSFDQESHIDCNDGEHGCTESFQKHFKVAKRFHDYKTRCDVLSKKSPHGSAVTSYKRAFSAPSLVELTRMKNAMPTHVQQALQQVPDEEQYPVAAQYLRGNRGLSSIVWKGDPLSDVRRAHLPGSMLKLVENIARRFERRKQDAMEWTAVLPPRVLTEISKAETDGARFSENMVLLAGDGQSATVRSIRVPGRTYRIVFDRIADADARSCDGNCSVLTGLPCEHQFAAVRTSGKRMHEVMHEWDCTDHWREFYQGVDIDMPSSAEIDAYEHLKDETLRLPPLLKPKRGRPRVSSRTECILERITKKRRIFHCAFCASADHESDECSARPR